MLSIMDTQDSGPQEERLLTKMTERVDGIVLGGSRMPTVPFDASPSSAR